MAADATMLTVEQAARTCGVSRRALQRLFRTYVGVGPKWMIRRYRIQEAAARLEAGDVDNCAELAHALGYADQSHFTNDFRRLVGRSPASYANAIGRP
jgi:AraC-like DNA-binding protein